MLTTIKPVNNAPVNRLVKVWADRYKPDLSICLEQDSSAILHLAEAASKKQRVETADRVRAALQLHCEWASIQTHALFCTMLFSLSDANALALLVKQVYEQALLIYQQQSPPPASAPAQTGVEAGDCTRDVMNWALAPEQLATALEPALLQLWEGHKLAQDPRTIGFITTQFHYTTQLVLKPLTLPEQILLSPYFRFMEEQVCIPLQRLCAAAAKHHRGSRTLALIQQMLPVSHEIAETVCQRAAELSPTYHSRRGKLSHSGVRTSTVRDLEMFQGYLWLCVIERSMSSMQQELIPLCKLVFPSVQVSSELVQQMLALLVDELKARSEPYQIPLFLPYAQAMQQLFSKLS